MTELLKRYDHIGEPAKTATYLVIENNSVINTIVADCGNCAKFERDYRFPNATVVIEVDDYDNERVCLVR
jgi:hypothetical protein